MKLKYININKKNKKLKLQKTMTKTLLVLCMSTLVGCSKTNDAVDAKVIEIVEEIEDEIASNDEMESDNITSSIVDKQIEVLYTESTSIPAASISPEPQQIALETSTQKTEKKVVAITFDDGPSKYTMDLAKILEENNANATFFVLGPCVENYNEAMVYAYETGNEIAVHGYTHTSFTKISIEEIQNEIDATKQIIESYGVECTDFVRPPYGNVNENIIENIDSTFILWNVDTRDWESRNVESIKEEVIGKIEEGDIILFHDIYDTTVQAISEILPELSNEYEFVTISELFRLKEQVYEENKKYYKVK